MAENRSIKRFMLSMIVGGLVVAALAGIYVLLFGQFSGTAAKILMTTFSICYFGVTSLACAAAYEKCRNRLLSAPGLAVSIAGFALSLCIIWAEWLWYEPIWKIMAILVVLSFCFARACLLSLVTLKRRVAWLYYAAVGAILALAAIVSEMIIEPNGDLMWRLAGAVAIVDGCLFLCVLVLHRLGGNSAVSTTAEPYQRIELVCPRCGQAGKYSIGSIKCPCCLLTIEVCVKVDSLGPI